jgi:hypothetical protein
VAVVNSHDLNSAASDILLSPEEFDTTLLNEPDFHNRFFFTWTTPWSSWNARHTLFLDSLFLYHPYAHVYFVAVLDDQALPPVFYQYARMGYHLKGVLVTQQQMNALGWWISPENQEWLIEASQNPPDWKFLFSHNTDYLRFYLLYKYGGTYTDTDAIALRSLPREEFIGMDFSDSTAEWFLDTEKHIYLAPGLMRVGPGRLMIRELFEKIFTVKSYKPECFNCVGPRAITAVMKAHLEAADPEALQIALYPTHFLYPMNFKEVSQLFYSSNSARTWGYLQHLRRSSYSLHLFGKMTKNLVPELGSFLDIVADDVSLAEAEPCSVAGATSMVVRGDTAELNNENVVAFAACANLQQMQSSLTCQASHGLLSFYEGEALQILSKEGTFTAQQVNDLLSMVVYHAPADKQILEDTINIELKSADGKVSVQRALRVLIYNRMVTIITHTHGRVKNVEALHASVQKWFPGTTVLASNDGEQKSPLELAERIRASRNSTLQWMQLPFDSGLSLGRNELILRASTPYVHLLDDDFTLMSTSHFDVLLTLLHGSTFDIASPKIPVDESVGWTFRGTIRRENSTLELVNAIHGTYQGCEHVDFVPNIFLAKRLSLLQSPWDSHLKLGEHEEFFFRAKQTGLQVLFCPNVEVRHNQHKWWKESNAAPDSYVGKRRRVREFWDAALNKHGLTKLVLFGKTLVDLDEKGTPDSA